MNVLRIMLAMIVIVLTTQVLPAVASDGCQYPFVWREAFQGDHVCVTPDIRAQAAADNAAAIDRINPVNHDYGPDTCRYGFVWREARPSDHVCVVPQTRAQAASDNAAASGRYAKDSDEASGSDAADSSSDNGSSPPNVSGPGCCPQSMLVCPLSRTWCPK